MIYEAMSMLHRWIAISPILHYPRHTPTLFPLQSSFLTFLSHPPMPFSPHLPHLPPRVLGCILPCKQKLSCPSPFHAIHAIRSVNTSRNVAAGAEGEDSQEAVVDQDIDQARKEDLGLEGENASKVWESEVGAGDVKLLARLRSQYNLITVLQLSRSADHPLAGARVLLLDRPGNIQSVYDPYRVLTNAYYDVLATLPPIIPHGPVAIYGLGAGTVAHILCHFWQGIDIHGWELDPAVVVVGRKFFCLAEFENSGDGAAENEDKPKLGFQSEDSLQKESYSSSNGGAAHEGKPKLGFESEDRLKKESCSSNDPSSGSGLGNHLFKDSFVGIHSLEGKNGAHVFEKGRLTVHIGDALGSEARVDGGFAGIIVDLFSKGEVIPSLLQTETWERLKGRLRAGGRIMVNCGGSCVESENKKDGGITMQECIAAMEKVFPGNLSKRVLRFNGDNCIALTGPTPDLKAWMRSLPKPLLRGIFDWEIVDGCNI